MQKSPAESLSMVKLEEQQAEVDEQTEFHPSRAWRLYSTLIGETGSDFPMRDLGKYQLREVLGCGGQSIAFKAWDRDLLRHVVIKLYHNASSDAERHSSSPKAAHSRGFGTREFARASRSIDLATCRISFFNSSQEKRCGIDWNANRFQPMTPSRS